MRNTIRLTTQASVRIVARSQCLDLNYKFKKWAPPPGGAHYSRIGKSDIRGRKRVSGSGGSRRFVKNFRCTSSVRHSQDQQRLICGGVDPTVCVVDVDVGFSEFRSCSSQLTHAIHVVIAGCAESTSPGILGFSFLGLTAMLTAVGRRRLDEKESASAR